MPQRLVSRSGDQVACTIRWATTPWARMRGLVGSQELEAGEALVLSPALQVHTFLLPYRIDVAMCDARWRVLWLRRSMKRNTLGPLLLGARYAVEMRAGALPAWMEPGVGLMLVE